jgi:hypothetical protein
MKHAAVFFLVIIPLGVACNGFVLSVLWNWFVAPAFSAPELSIGYASGIFIIVRFLVDNNLVNEHKSRATSTLLMDSFIEVAVGPLVSLLLGAIIKALIISL